MKVKMNNLIPEEQPEDITNDGLLENETPITEEIPEEIPEDVPDEIPEDEPGETSVAEPEDEPVEPDTVEEEPAVAEPEKKVPTDKVPVKEAPAKKAPAKKAPVKKAPVKETSAKEDPQPDETGDDIPDAEMPDDIPDDGRPASKKEAKAARKAEKKAAKASKKRDKGSGPKARTVLPWVILGALAVSGITYGVAIHIQTEALSAYDKQSVYIAGSALVDGHVLNETEITGLTASVELPVDTVPADAVTDLSLIMNTAARYDITPGTILCSSMFETVDEMQAGLKEPVIAGFRSDDIYQVVGGVLRPGDTISIYTVDNTSQIGTAVYEGTLRWDNIRVQDVFDNTGTRIESTDDITPAARVNIYMDKSEVEEFYAKLAQGSLRVVVHCN